MILGDYHTHTKNSDGKGTLEQTLIAADKVGLVQVGISDHGLRHSAMGMKFRDIAKARKIMDDTRDKYRVQCLLSIEANIYTSQGDIDLTEQDRDLFDYVVAGYHKAPWPKSFKEAFTYNIPALFANKHAYTDNQRRKFTAPIVKAITSNKINILSHLNYGIPSFVEEVGKAAIDYNVYIELNGKRVSMTDEEVMKLYDMGVTFIVNSDGHHPDRIGDFSVPMTVVERLNLDKERIINYNKLPQLYIRH